MERSMSPEEHPTPPDSPKATTPPLSGLRPIAMLLKTSPGTSGTSTPSSFGLGELYRTPVQTITEVEDEVMEEGETSEYDSPMEEGQIIDPRESTPDSMDVGILPTPPDWLDPTSP